MMTYTYRCKHCRAALNGVVTRYKDNTRVEIEPCRSCCDLPRITRLTPEQLDALEETIRKS